MGLPSKPVIQYDLKGKEVAWHPTLAQAAIAAGVTKPAMSIYLAGKRKTPICAGFVWKYAPAADVEQIVKEQEPPKKELPVNPHSDEYKWMNFRQRIEYREKLKRDHETRKRNESQDY